MGGPDHTGEGIACRMNFGWYANGNTTGQKHSDRRQIICQASSGSFEDEEATELLNLAAAQ